MAALKQLKTKSTKFSNLNITKVDITIFERQSDVRCFIKRQ